MRGLDDVESWLAQDRTGSAETGAAPFWRLLAKYRPDARVLLVRRPWEAVVDSLMAIDNQGSGAFHKQLVAPIMRRLDAKLDQIAARWPGPLLSVDFSQLSEETTARRVFEHCLPYAFDRAWFARLVPVNIQCSMPALMRYAKAFRPQMNKLAAVAKHTMLADLATHEPVLSDGMSIQQERFADWYADAKDLIEDHLVQVGEGPDAHFGKNLGLMRTLDDLGNMQIMTARSNGRMFGYLMTILSPSLESPKTKIAVQTTFFASKDSPGLGMKLQRASIAALKERGTDEIFFRAGPRGSGPKMGALYRRLGAQDDGQMFRLNLGT